MSMKVIERLLEFNRSPNRPRADNATLLAVLVDVLNGIEKQGGIDHDGHAVLYGVAAEIMSRVRDAMPAPKRVDGSGNPVWCVGEVADFLGMGEADLEKALDATEEQGFAFENVTTTHPLQ